VLASASVALSRGLGLTAAEVDAAAASIRRLLFEEAAQVNPSGALPVRSLALLRTHGLLTRRCLRVLAARR